MIDPKIDHAWQQLMNIQHEIRKAATVGPFHTYHSPRMSSPAKSKMKCVSSNRDVCALVSQSRKYVGIIREAGSDFLKKEGYTSGGLIPKSKPRKPKSQDAIRAEIALIETQLATMK